MRKPEQVEAAVAAVFPDAKFGEKHPQIVAYLTDDKWEDGKPRELSSIAVKVQDGRILVALNDVALRRSLYVSGDSLEAALRALERNLGLVGADWRKWNQGRKK